MKRRQLPAVCLEPAAVPIQYQNRQPPPAKRALEPAGEPCARSICTTREGCALRALSSWSLASRRRLPRWSAGLSQASAVAYDSTGSRHKSAGCKDSQRVQLLIGYRRSEKKSTGFGRPRSAQTAGTRGRHSDMQWRTELRSWNAQVAARVLCAPPDPTAMPAQGARGGSP